MEKVKLTQEQAGAIIKYKELQRKEFEDATFPYVNWARPLGDLTTDDFMDALYIGYEVVTDFKVGDWIAHINTNVIELVADRNIHFINKEYSEKDKLRHATPEEIATEKTRRWWTKHDRAPWEVKEGDILKDLTLDDFLEVKAGSPHELPEGMRNRYRISCFAEDRKDA